MLSDPLLCHRVHKLRRHLCVTARQNPRQTFQSEQDGRKTKGRNGGSKEGSAIKIRCCRGHRA
eukprot:867180-Rhodomonas_salina.1